MTACAILMFQENKYQEFRDKFSDVLQTVLETFDTDKKYYIFSTSIATGQFKGFQTLITMLSQKDENYAEYILSYENYKFLKLLLLEEERNQDTHNPKLLKDILKLFLKQEPEYVSNIILKSKHATENIKQILQEALKEISQQSKQNENILQADNENEEDLLEGQKLKKKIHKNEKVAVQQVLDQKEEFQQENQQQEFQGDGTVFNEKSTQNTNKFFTTYWNEGVENILYLRLDIANLKNEVAVSKPLLLIENNVSSSSQLTLKIKELLSNDDNTKILIPLNIDNRHWVGLVISDGIAHYMDSENNIASDSLMALLASVGISLKQIQVEHQKYNNCGPEMIENFIWYLTGYRADQQNAVAIHSTIFEEEILQEAKAHKAHVQLQRINVLMKSLNYQNAILDEKLFAQLQYYTEEGIVFATLAQNMGSDDTNTPSDEYISENNDEEYTGLFNSLFDQIAKLKHFVSENTYYL